MATVTAAALVGVICLTAVALAGTARVISAHIRATAAADAAALAAAPLTFLGGDPAAEADKFARANGAKMVDCSCLPDRSWRVRVVTVEVASVIDLPVVGSVELGARAAAEFDPMALLEP